MKDQLYLIVTIIKMSKKWNSPMAYIIKNPTVIYKGKP